MYNKVEVTGINTTSLKVLTEAEKIALLKRLQEGEQCARDELVNGNLRLVLSIVQRFSGRGENPDDLFQVGCIGLMKAIDNFDLSIGVKFSTYAVPMIIGEIRRYLRDNNSIRVSRSMRDLAYKSLQARELLSKTLLKEPTIEDIAKAVGEPQENVSRAMEAIIEPVSLYDSVFSDGEDSIFVIDQISDHNVDDELWLEDIALKNAIKTLGKREKKILNLRFYKGKTQVEIAEEIGISQAQVSRLEKGALERIKRQMD